MQNRILVILDLDETLIHATSSPPNNAWDFVVFNYNVYRRPGLDSFLETITPFFDIAVWSSASDDYVKKVVQEIFSDKYNLIFVWGRSRWLRKIDYNLVEDYGYFDENDHLNYTKPLKKIKKRVSQNLGQILIIDDTPGKCVDNYGNAIYPKGFYGDPKDNELALLGQYLISLKDEENVRVIEKRGWRNNYT